MAIAEVIPGVAAAGERAERAWRTPLGAVSPLWAIFGAAAGAGVAYWWISQWTRAVNVEAFLAAKPLPAPKTPAPIEIIAEPLVEAAAETVEASAEVIEMAAEAAEALEAPLAAPAPAAPDDLTRMVGVGPKLAAALAERGVTRFAEIAAWTADDLAELDAALSLKGRAVREAWVAQAKRLASED
jgi:predicted flap endonuclease-1-like 5' DNA nuclease